jgi:hypothetical protein
MNCLNNVFVLKPNKNMELALMRGACDGKSRGDCQAFEQIISLYVDSILEQSIAIKQIAAYLKVAC